MSKSKSRQPSRQLSAGNRSGSNGAASLHKATAKVAVESASEDTEHAAEQETSIATVAAEDASESTEQEASVAKTAQAVASKATAKGAADEASTGTAKETSAAKSAKAASGKAVPAKVTAKAVPNTPALRSAPGTPAGAGGRMQTRDAAKYERRQAERQTRYLAERRRRRNRIVTAISVILIVALVGAGTYWVIRLNTASAAQTKAGQGTYQEAIFNTNYPPVESVYCDELEQSVEHIHAYVAIYINGTASPLPANVGIPQDSSGNATCFYWLHTHDTTGVVHIESPSTEVFTFGQFRDEWDQQFVSLGFPPELLLTTGWKIWIDGKVYNGSLASIPLEAHSIITMAYNSPNVKPVTTYAWNGL